MVISLRGSFYLDELPGRVAASLDASTNRDEKCTCGADDSKNGCWIFWGVHEPPCPYSGRATEERRAMPARTRQVFFICVLNWEGTVTKVECQRRMTLTA